MRTLLNIIWVIFGGFWLWLGYLFFGVIACIFIVTIPAGVACFRIAGYVLWPFGREVVPTPRAWRPSRSSPVQGRLYSHGPAHDGSPVLHTTVTRRPEPAVV